MKKICHVHLEGGDAAGVKAPSHVTDAVATPLQRKHPTAEPNSHQVGRNKSFIHQLGDPRHLMINVSITFTRLLRPVMLAWGRQRELWKIQQIPVFIRGIGHIKEPNLPVLDGLWGSGMRITVSSANIDDSGSTISHHLGIHLLLGLAVSVVNSSPDQEAAELEKPAPQANSRPHPKVSLAQSDEGREEHHGVGAEVLRLEAIEV